MPKNKWEEEYFERFNTDNDKGKVEIIDECYKFIKDLKQSDRDELIKRLPEDYNSDTFLYKNQVKGLIKDYYNK